MSVQLGIANNTILASNNNDGVYEACFIPWRSEGASEC